ncbi:MAG: hypothetical protein ABI702_00390 [Burkholderiales bacterium]
MTIIQFTDIRVLAKLVHGKSHEAALPTELEDNLLQQISRDLRQLEPLWTERDAENEHDAQGREMAGPLLLITHVLVAKARAENALHPDLAWHQYEFPVVLNTFQFAVEREVVARHVGIRFRSDPDAFMSLVDKKIERSRTLHDPD